MTADDQQEPRLIFFRAKPSGLTSRPPLASSLQHLESSFLFISVGRYPHALETCESAFESAIKAALGLPDKYIPFDKLIKKARAKHRSYTDLSDPEILEFREMRNHIVHWGFSPRDNAVSGDFLLRVGYPLVEQSYESFFQFSLLGGRGDALGGLLPDFGQHLNIARRVYFRARNEKQIDPTHCFRSFAHAIRWQIQDWVMSDSQLDLLDSEEQGGWATFKFQDERKRQLDSIFDASWRFKCPVCGTLESFVCELDVKRLHATEVSLKRGMCVNCDLVIPDNCPFLADELCTDQIGAARPLILREYGII